MGCFKGMDAERSQFIWCNVGANVSGASRFGEQVAEESLQPLIAAGVALVVVSWQMLVV